MNDDDITVVEGGKSVCVTFTSKLSPSSICAAGGAAPGTCQVFIRAHFVTVKKALKCQKQVVDQAVIGYQGQVPDDVLSPEESLRALSACGILVTETNWQEDLCVPVKAKFDGIVEHKTKTRDLIFTEEVRVEGKVINSRTITTIKVSQLLLRQMF